MYFGDSLDVLEKAVDSASVDLIVTSPPYGLVRKKKYGNVDADGYVEWFKPFASLFRRLLKPNGSFVLTWAARGYRGNRLEVFTFMICY